MNQRDKMRELFQRYGDNESILIQKYAEAEQRGEVKRKSDQNNVSPEEYAVRLLADARRKGWIPGL